MTLDSLGYFAAIALLDNPENFPNLVELTLNADESSAYPENSFITEDRARISFIKTLTLQHDKRTLLPHSLTSLNTYALFGLVHSELLQTLPKTLISLRVDSLKWDSIAHLSWPPNLASLTLTSDKGFAPSYFQALPRSITKLSVNKSFVS